MSYDHLLALVNSLKSFMERVSQVLMIINLCGTAPCCTLLLHALGCTLIRGCSDIHAILDLSITALSHVVSIHTELAFRNTTDVRQLIPIFFIHNTIA